MLHVRILHTNTYICSVKCPFVGRCTRAQPTGPTPLQGLTVRSKPAAQHTVKSWQVCILYTCLEPDKRGKGCWHLVQVLELIQSLDMDIP